MRQNAAGLRLKGKVETGEYDVFLCCSSRDRKQVMAIGERLSERGIRPWLDNTEIRPGTRWQQELRKRIKSIRSRNRPIIPVILEGRPADPRLPEFLSLWHLVDMRKADPDPMEQLVWGITGERP